MLTPDQRRMGGAAATNPSAHASAPLHAGANRMLIPLSAVAEIRIVEGPAVIKSEDGALLNYVTLNVRGATSWVLSTRPSASWPIR